MKKTIIAAFLSLVILSPFFAEAGLLGGGSVTTTISGGYEPTGGYVAETTYTVGKGVSYNGSSYVAIRESQGNLPTNTTYWQVMSSKGDAGSPGTDGTNAYVYIRYASDASGTGCTATPSDSLGYIGITESSTTITDPCAALTGSWKKYQGPQGAKGDPGNTGPAAASQLGGSGAPASGTGNNGDYYWDMTNKALYGPKASGEWPPASFTFTVDSCTSNHVCVKDGSGNVANATNLTDTVYAPMTVGTSVALTEAGQIGIDTSTDQFRYRGGAQRVLPYIQSASLVIPAPVDTDDLNIMKAPYGMTLLGINCIVQGTTSVTGQLQECDSSGANCADLDSDITCDADGAADDGTLTDSTIASGAWIRWKTTSVSGTPTFLAVTFRYAVIAD